MAVPTGHTVGQDADHGQDADLAMVRLGLVEMSTRPWLAGRNCGIGRHYELAGFRGRLFSPDSCESS